METYSIIKDHLDRYIAGQDDAKEKLSILGTLYAQRCNNIAQGAEPEGLPRLNMFVTGPTGTGKTYMISKLAEVLGLPFVRIDCSSLCQVGWAGEGLDDLLKPFAKGLQGDKFGVIMLDEFDKLGDQKMSAGGSIPNLGIQYNLLDLLDGRYTARDVNNCLILCAGAFSAATKEHMHVNKGMGFQYVTEPPIENWKKLMVAGGIVPELTGRMIDVVRTKALTKEEIKDIIINKKGNVLSKYKNLMLNIKFTDEDIDMLVDKTFGSEFGLRELETITFNVVKEKLLTRFNKVKL